MREGGGCKIKGCWPLHFLLAASIALKDPGLLPKKIIYVIYTKEVFCST